MQVKILEKPYKNIMHCRSPPSKERIISTNYYFENAAHGVPDSDEGKQRQQHVWGRELAPLTSEWSSATGWFCQR